jgi:glycosyltransferase involved in cell wall biosynthesis
VQDEVTGLMVDPDDHAGMAEAALRLLREPELAAALAQRAYEECRTRYDWAVVGREWLALYRELAGRAAAAAPGAPRG